MMMMIEIMYSDNDIMVLMMLILMYLLVEKQQMSINHINPSCHTYRYICQPLESTPCDEYNDYHYHHHYHHRHHYHPSHHHYHYLYTTVVSQLIVTYEKGWIDNKKFVELLRSMLF